MMTPLEARLTEENAALRAENKAQQIEIKLLREKVDLLIRRIFGRSSEQIDDGQLLLLLQGGDDVYYSILKPTLHSFRVEPD